MWSYKWKGLPLDLSLVASLKTTELSPFKTYAYPRLPLLLHFIVRNLAMSSYPIWSYFSPSFLTSGTLITESIDHQIE